MCQFALACERYEKRERARELLRLRGLSLFDLTEEREGSTEKSELTYTLEVL